jgi:RNA polymerase primary sigma factor
MSLVINLKADTGLVLRSDNTTRFYKDIKKFDVMTREEEADWFTMLSEARKKAEKAREEGNSKTAEEMEKLAQEIKDLIVSSNLRLCVAAAKNWANTDTLMDYVNEANIGLMEAVDKFDVTRGVKFASYAMWFIKRAIENFHHGMLPIVRRTNNAKTWSVISKVISDFTQKYERIPTQDELLELVNQKLKKGIKDKADLTEMYVTMVDEYTYDNDEKMYNSDAADYNRASASLNDYEYTETEDYNKKLVASLLEVLPPREQKLIQMRFGLIEVNGIKREFELSEVAEELGITSERVRQLEASILKKLMKAYEEKIASEM